MGLVARYRRHKDDAATFALKSHLPGGCLCQEKAAAKVHLHNPFEGFRLVVEEITKERNACIANGHSELAESRDSFYHHLREERYIRCVPRCAYTPAAIRVNFRYSFVYEFLVDII